MSFKMQVTSKFVNPAEANYLNGSTISGSDTVKPISNNTTFKNVTTNYVGGHVIRSVDNCGDDYM